MTLKIVRKTIDLGDGRSITLETGKLAKQADGSAVIRMGDCMLLATVVASKEAKPGIDFLPLSVDYQEKFASAGRIPGGFLRREGRLSDREVLICRIVDRALRPLFPDDFHADVQVMVTLISADPQVQPDALAGLAASAALAVSDIPLTAAMSEVRVAQVDGKLIINPSTDEIAKARLDLIVGATAKDIVMVEGEADEVSEAEMVEAIQFAHNAIKKHIEVLAEFRAENGVTTYREYNHEVNDPELKAELTKALFQKVYNVAAEGNADKSLRKEKFAAVLKEYLESLSEAPDDAKLSLIKRYYHDIEKDAMREMVLTERSRLDGRKLDEIRPIWAEVDYLPSPHGSAVFTRGETQSLTTVTLGTKLDEQIIDSAMFQGTSKFLLHYNFPGFSTGEVKPNRGASRREIGHGNLAYRALKKVMPPEEGFPYTVRIVSDILESNGSSSMATVCAGTLALMDAGINIAGPVSGIAMGLITKGDRYAVLSDILGDEDHLGDMDFKVTGTEKGITACQMDLKVDGLPYSVMEQALEQARKGRLHILGEMRKALAEPRGDMKPHAPRSTVIRINSDQIGAVIGPGGKVVQEIQRSSGATISIEDAKDHGVVSIYATSKEAMDKAVKAVKGIVTLPEVGEVYDGKVRSIQPFGAFVEILPGKDGLLHISEIKWERLPSMDGVLEIGEEIKVKLIEVDAKTGKLRLSRKALLPRPERAERED